jgi:hypothetical protein
MRADARRDGPVKDFVVVNGDVPETHGFLQAQRPVRVDHAGFGQTWKVCPWYPAAFPFGQ